MKTNNHYRKLIEGLKLLSLPYKEQRQYFPEFVDVPFEVLDTFENAFLLLPNLLDEKKISYNGISDLLRLHNLITLTSNTPIFRDLEEEQFSYAPEWNRVRELAIVALQSFGEPLERPNAEYI